VSTEAKAPTSSTIPAGDKVVKSEAEWRAELSPAQYRVLRQQGTEHAFTGPYWDEKRAGTYLCAACGTPLFSSTTKFDSGTGWPSFYAPLDPAAVSNHEDRAHGMVRVESRCARCDSHLGHVFPDGPKPTGLRFCMNGTALALKLDETPASDTSDAG